MRLTTPFTALRNVTSNIWKMHDFNYQLPKDHRQDYWEKECIDTHQVLIAKFTKANINKILLSKIRVFM